MRKRILSMVLAVVMVISLLPVSVFAEEPALTTDTGTAAEESYGPYGQTEEIFAGGEAKQVDIELNCVYLSFTPEKTALYVFWSENCGDSYVELRASDKERLISDDDGGVGGNFKFSYGCKAGETYYLKCSSGDDVDTYDVYVKELSEGVLTVGGQAKSVAVAPGECAYLMFIPEKDGTYVFRSENSINSCAELLSENGDWLAENDYDYEGDSDDFMLGYTCKAGEVYYLKCMTRCEEGDVDEYDVIVESLSVPTSAGTLTADGRAQHVVCDGKEVYLAFTPEKTGTYIFRSENCADSRAELYTISDVQLCYVMGDDDGGDDNNFRFSYICKAGVTYWLKCDSYHDSDEYDVSVVCDSEDIKTDGELTVGGQAQHVTVNYDDGTMRFSFKPEKDGVYAFKAKGSDGVYAMLLKLTGTGFSQVVGGYRDEYDNLILNCFCEAGETYYIDYGSEYGDDEFDVYVRELASAELSIGREPQSLIIGENDGQAYVSFTPDTTGMYVVGVKNTDENEFAHLDQYVVENGRLSGINSWETDMPYYNFMYFLRAGVTYYFGVTAACDISVSPMARGKLTVGEEIRYIPFERGDWVCYSFSPRQDGYYTFRSENAVDCRAELYSADGDFLRGKACYEDGNFELTYACKAGRTYYLRCDSDYSGFEFDLSVEEFTVHTSGTLSAGEWKRVEYDGEDVCFAFTPERNGTYIFRSDNCADSRASLVIADKGDIRELVYNDDGGNECNFRIVYACKAGETYYLKCGSCCEYDEYDLYVDEVYYSFEWSLDDNGVLTISGEGAMSNYGTDQAPWGADHYQIDSIVIESGITAICDWAFCDCYNFKSLSIPASVTSVGGYAFENCSWLSDIYYSGTIAQWNEIEVSDKGNDHFFMSTVHCTDGDVDNSTKCGTNATWSFADGVLTISGTGEMWDLNNNQPWEEFRDSITSVVVENGITSIGLSAFFDCTELESVSLPEGITVIGPYAFMSCRKLTDITIPGSVESIGGYAFDGYMPEEITYNGTCKQWNGIWFSCYENTELYTAVIHCTDGDIDNTSRCGDRVRWSFKDGELRIFGEGEMFVNNVDRWDDVKQSVKSIVIEDGVTLIGNSAFANFTNLESVTIPSSMSNINNGAFGNCTSLKDVYYQGSEEEWDWISVEWGPDGGDEDLPDNYALQNATMHYNVEMERINRCGPDAVCSVENGVLTIGGSGDLWDFDPDIYGDIPWWDVHYDVNTIVVEDGITKIGANSFRECYNVGHVTLPASIDTIGFDAFRYCENLDEINFLGTREQWREINIQENEELKNVVIRCTDGDIDNYHVCGAEGDNAIWSFENGVLTIKGTGAMADYDYDNRPLWYNFGWGINSVVIEDGITSIGDYAFMNCYEIRSVSIPASVTKIGENTLQHLYNDCRISFAGTKAQWMAIDHAGYDRTFNVFTIHCSDGDLSLNQFCGAEGNWGTNAAWSFADGVITFSGSGAISEDCAGWEVPWNEYIEEITGIVIEKGITYFGCLLYANSNLKTLTVPEDITIGQLYPAGGGEPPLRDIYYGGTAQQWEACKARSWGSWYYDTLYNIHFIDGSVQDNFHTCGDGMTWSVENGVLTISGTGAIDYHNWTVGDEKITSVVIPEGVTAICDYAFENCRELKSVYIPDSVTSIGYGVFAGCTSLESISIPAGVTVINSSTFFNCRNLRRITLKNGITTIGEGPYYNYYSSSSNMSIYNPAFYGCINLSEVEYEGTISDWNAIDIAANPEGDLELLRAKVIASDGEIPGDTNSCGYDASWSLDDGVLTISGTGSVSDFYYSTAPWAKHKDEITTVTVEDGITRIGAYAFSVNGYDFGYDYPNLKTVNIPASVTGFGDYAFGSVYDCFYDEETNLNKIKYVFTGTLNYDGTIEQWYDMDNAPTTCIVNCSDGVIDDFFWCGRGDEAWEITDAAKWSLDGDVLTVSGTGVLTDKSGYDAAQYWMVKGVRSLIIEEGIESIGDGLFSNLSIDHVELPASLRRINSSVFAGCDDLTEINYAGTKAQWNDVAVFDLATTGLTVHCSDGDIEPSWLSWTFKDGVLTVSGNRAIFADVWTKEISKYDVRSVVIEEGISSICAGVFCGYYELTELSLPESLRTIDSSAFLDCIKLGSVDIPENVIDIEYCVFEGCSSLEKVGSLGGISRIEEFTFFGCENLKSAEIPGSVTEIQYCAFKNCSSLEGIEIPSSIKSIERAAFEGCTSFTEIAIPGSVASIGENAFRECTNLESVSVCEGVKTIDSLAFYGCSSLESIILPSSLEYLGEFMFNGCSNLKDIYFCGSEQQWDELCGNAAMVGGPEGVTVHFNSEPPAASASFSVSNVKALAGEEVTVSVNLENNPGIMAMVLNVDYDKTKLKLLGVEDGGLTGWDFTTKAVWSDTKDSFYNGEILKLRFKVLENTGIGNVKVSVSADRGNIANYSEKAVSAEFTSGGVTVYKPGDMNGDGKVNAIDLVRLVKFMSGESVELIATADVTGDGAINSPDLVRLKKYIAGAQVVLH